jgi:hypothetical protein
VKKTYVKPVLLDRGRLAALTAQQNGAGSPPVKGDQ